MELQCARPQMVSRLGLVRLTGTPLETRKLTLSLKRPAM